MFRIVKRIEVAYRLYCNEMMDLQVASNYSIVLLKLGKEIRAIQ